MLKLANFLNMLHGKTRTPVKTLGSKVRSEFDFEGNEIYMRTYAELIKLLFKVWVRSLNYKLFKIFKFLCICVITILNSNIFTRLFVCYKHILTHILFKHLAS